MTGLKNFLPLQGFFAPAWRQQLIFLLQYQRRGDHLHIPERRSRGLRIGRSLSHLSLA